MFRKKCSRSRETFLRSIIEGHQVLVNRAVRSGTGNHQQVFPSRISSAAATRCGIRLADSASAISVPSVADSLSARGDLCPDSAPERRPARLTTRTTTAFALTGGWENLLFEPQRRTCESGAAQLWRESPIFGYPSQLIHTLDAKWET